MELDLAAAPKPERIEKLERTNDIVLLITVYVARLESQIRSLQDQLSAAPKQQQLERYDHSDDNVVTQRYLSMQYADCHSNSTVTDGPV